MLPDKLARVVHSAFIFFVCVSNVPAQAQDGKRSRLADREPLKEGEFEKLVTSDTGPVKGAISKDVEALNPDCGANSLYVFLRACGIRCSREHIHKLVPVTGSGASMKDLQDAALKYGVETAVVKLRPTSLASYSPSIALLSQTSSNIGHFVVVVEIKNELVEYVDGTTGVKASVRFSEFERLFSGHALIRKQNWLMRFLTFTFLATIVAEVVLICYYVFKRKENFTGHLYPS